MTRFKSLQVLWGGLMMAVLVYAGLAYWLAPRSGGVAASSGAVATASVLVGIAVVCFGLAVGMYQAKWRPLCDEALKRVWAGRLADAANARSVTSRLHAQAVVIMALCEAPAIYGLVLALMQVPSPSVMWGLMGSSAAALLLFYWYGISAASDIFQHAERIARP